jgi:hypothetical protein
MQFVFYQIVENLAKSNLSHIKLHLVDSISKKVIENYVKLKIGTALEDDSSNIFRITGYYGEYMIVHPDKPKTHPSGQYLIWKKK